MNEAQIEALEKMFPNGYVIFVKPSNETIHTRMFNPLEAVTLAEMYGAGLGAWKALSDEAAE